MSPKGIGRAVSFQFVNTNVAFFLFSMCAALFYNPSTYICTIFTYIPCILILSKFLYSPTDAQVNCLKNNIKIYINPLSPELNPICYLLALLGAHHFFHVIRIRVKSLTFRQLMSYIYMEHPFLMFLDHTQRRSTVGRTPLDE